MKNLITAVAFPKQISGTSAFRRLGLVFGLILLLGGPAWGQVSYFNVRGGWAGNDANGNAIIKWTIEVCADAGTQDVHVRVPTIGNGTGEGAGTADALSDEDSPFGVGSCNALRWRDLDRVLVQTANGLRMPNNVGSIANPDRVTPDTGLDFVETGCVTLNWVTYSKDYDSSGNDEDHYVVANVTSAAAGQTTDPGFDCSVQDNNGNAGCTINNTNTSVPRCTNLVDCDDVATNNYEQILGLAIVLASDSISDNGLQYHTEMAYVLCHHGESDYEAGYDVVSPGNNNSVDIIPDDIVNIAVQTNEWDRTAANGQLEIELQSVRFENPGQQLIQPAPAFAPFGTEVAYTNTASGQLITNPASSFLPMDASQNNLNDIDGAGCNNFVPVCDTIFIHSTYNLVFSNNNGGEQCNTFRNIGSATVGYAPRNGYQSTGDDDGIPEGPPVEQVCITRSTIS